MDRKEILEFSESIIQGGVPDEDEYRKILKVPAHRVRDLFPGADLLRNHYFGKEIHLCSICNGKSGKCSEDCSFCAQSVFANTDASVYPLMERDDLIKGGLYASEKGINRYSIVTSGRRLPKREVKEVAEAMRTLAGTGVESCVSLGTLDFSDFLLLKKAGITRYHHNLETSESLFPEVCSTHTYGDRVNTITRAGDAGLSICSGGIFGLGESDDQLLELALALKDLDVDSVPINFLVPIKGTPLEGCRHLSPLRCLKIISLFRFVLPEKEIIICAGREEHLGNEHSLIFQAGASGIMTGNYLTTEGRSLERDLKLIESLGLRPREKKAG